MNLSDLQDLKQLALQAEMARPLTHECNNFLNNLLLQLAISEKSFPESMRAEWANLRRDGKKLAALLQQWQRQRKHSSEGAATNDLNQAIHEAVEEFRRESAAFQLDFRPAAEPLWLTGGAGDVQRLVSLLLRYASGALETSGIESPALEIELASSQDRILLRVRNAGPAETKLVWTDFDDAAAAPDRAAASLVALTCKSLVERLGGDIRIEPDANNGGVLTVDLPLAQV